MTSFVHTQFPSAHPGVERAENVAAQAQKIAKQFDGAKGLAALLLAAIVSALLVVANQVIDTWTDGHLLAGWVALWLVAFAAIALLATPARSAAHTLRKTHATWKVQRKEAAADEKLWDLAQRDARIMAELSRAMMEGAGRDVRGFN